MATRDALIEWERISLLRQASKFYWIGFETQVLFGNFITALRMLHGVPEFHQFPGDMPGGILPYEWGFIAGSFGDGLLPRTIPSPSYDEFPDKGDALLEMHEDYPPMPGSRDFGIIKGGRS